MKFNSGQVLCFLVIIFSFLLIGASSVCAQDTDTTDNITDDIGQNIIINENDLNICENSTLENSTTYENNTATYAVNFADTKMDICPMINGALNDTFTSIDGNGSTISDNGVDDDISSIGVAEIVVPLACPTLPILWPLIDLFSSIFD